MQTRGRSQQQQQQSDTSGENGSGGAEDQVDPNPLVPDEAVDALLRLNPDQLETVLQRAQHRSNTNPDGLTSLQLAANILRQADNPSVVANILRISQGHQGKTKQPARAQLPKKYSGVGVKEAVIMLQQLDHYLTTCGITDDQHKIEEMGSCLEGSAWTWYNAFNELNTDRSYQTFKDNFRKAFNVTDLFGNAQTTWNTLIQKDKQIMDFIIEFRNAMLEYNTHCPPTERITQTAAVDAFIEKLNSDWLNRLQEKVTLLPTTTLDEIVVEVEKLRDSDTRFKRGKKIAADNRRQNNDVYKKGKVRPMTEDELAERDRKKQKTEKEQKGKSHLRCNHCRKRGHIKSDCPEYEPSWDPKSKDPSKCQECGKPGHSKDQCWKKHPELRPTTSGGKKKKSGLHMIVPESNETKTRLEIKAKINKRPYYLFFDTGSFYNIMTRAVAAELGIKIVKDASAPELTWGDENTILGSGEFITEPVPMEIGNHTENIQFQVVDKAPFSILIGLEWARKHQPTVNWNTDEVAFNSDHCKKHCQLAHKVNLEEVPLFKNKRVVGMIECPNEELEESRTFVVVTERAKRQKSAPDRVLTIRTRNVSSCDFDIPYLKFNGRRHKKAQREYHVLVIKPGKSPALDAPDYHDSEQAFKELTEEEKRTFPEQYKDFIDVFSKKNANTLPQHRPYDLPIPVTENFKPTWGPIYNLNEEEMKLLKEYIDKNLAKGFIRPSSSPCGAPVLFVPKPKGRGLRLCIDYRALNSFTIKDRYPLPLIDSLLDRLGKAKIFTALDLKGAYNLVRIKEGDEWKTAFRTRYGHYEMTVMPFGLTNAPACFQRLMNDIFKDIVDIYVVVYLDDILIYSQDENEHENHVKEVLTRLRKYNLYCEYEKCMFHVPEVEFLGFVVGINGIKMSMTKVESVLQWAVPKNRTEVMSFLGFANYYRRFVNGFAKIATPLRLLTHKEGEFKWTDAAQKSFDSLKVAFTSAPILKIADYSKQFVLETDASDYALGSVLSQEFDGKLHPIAFYSKKFTSTEANWEIHDKELYAIITSLRHWRHFLLAGQHKTQIYSDHKNLEFFMTKQKLNQRQIRWMHFLADYDFNITHKPGEAMGKADALSRQHEFKATDAEKRIKNSYTMLKENSISKQQVFLVQIPTRTELYNTIAAHTLQSQMYASLLDESIKLDNQLGHLRPHCSVQNGLVKYKNERVFIEDDESKLAILRALHDSPTAGHFGYQKTYAAVSKEFFWPQMKIWIEEYCKSCDVCQRTKQKKHKPYGLLQTMPIANRPWSIQQMDFIGPLPKSSGFDSIFVVICPLTKLTHFIPVNSSITVQELSKIYMSNIYKAHGLPDTIVSDRDKLFTSKFWVEFTKALGVEHKLSTAFHQQTNGMTERVIQTLKGYLRSYINYKQDDWVEYLPYAEFAYNNAKHASTNLSPFAASYGYDFNVLPKFNATTEDSVPSVGERVKILNDIHEYLQEAMKEAQSSQKEYADRLRLNPPNFKVGDRVWLLTTNLRSDRPSKKLDYKRLGPYEILEQVNAVSFRLKLPNNFKIHDVFHVNLLEVYHPNTIPGRIELPPPPCSVAHDDGISYEEYEVESVLDCRLYRGKKQYLVHWKGYGVDDRSWEPMDNLANAKDLVADFHMAHPDASCSSYNAGNKRKRFSQPQRETRKRVKPNANNKNH